LATLALVVALLSFLNLAGIEKAILAVVLGARALTATPEPSLEQRRTWAQTAVGLAAAHIVLLITIILLNLDRLPRVYEAFRALSDLH
jgi:uncharacterized membrane protein YgdD (TMEM256/DUF423 family)